MRRSNLKSKGKGKGKAVEKDGEDHRDRDDDEKEEEEEEEEEEYTNILDAARKIYQTEGLGALYVGLAQDTAKTVADSFLFFLAYEFFRRRRVEAVFGNRKAGRTRRAAVLPVFDELVVGVLAGAFAKLFTTPLANVVTRKQTTTASSSSSAGKEALSTREIVKRIHDEKGVSGFWSGYSATLVLTLNPSITFFLNELLKYAVVGKDKGRAGGRSRISPAMTFLLAALSKAAASTVTYPISMAKTRAQATDSSTSDEQVKGKESQTDDADTETTYTPQVISTVLNIARTEGISSLYAGLPAEVLKGFFSHGFTILAKDAVYSLILKSYYLLLIVLRKYPTPEELLDRAREQAEEYAEAAREGAKDLAESTKKGAEEALDHHAGNVAVDMTSNPPAEGVDSSSGLRVPHPEEAEMNETAELVGDYVEDEAAEWRSLYHWFWEKEKHGGGH
jgi:hypothetical protein